MGVVVKTALKKQYTLDASEPTCLSTLAKVFYGESTVWAGDMAFELGDV